MEEDENGKETNVQSRNADGTLKTIDNRNTIEFFSDLLKLIGFKLSVKRVKSNGEITRVYEIDLDDFKYKKISALSQKIIKRYNDKKDEGLCGTDFSTFNNERLFD